MLNSTESGPDSDFFWKLDTRSFSLVTIVSSRYGLDKVDPESVYLRVYVTHQKNKDHFYLETFENRSLSNRV